MFPLYGADNKNIRKNLVSQTANLKNTIMTAASIDATVVIDLISIIFDGKIIRFHFLYGFYNTCLSIIFRMVYVTLHMSDMHS